MAFVGVGLDKGLSWDKGFGFGVCFSSRVPWTLASAWVSFLAILCLEQMFTLGCGESERELRVLFWLELELRGSPCCWSKSSRPNCPKPIQQLRTRSTSTSPTRPGPSPGRASSALDPRFFAAVFSWWAMQTALGGYGKWVIAIF